MDINGNLRRNNETWKNSSCVACQCVNSTINCTRYDVNVTNGLYSVELVPTCEKCAVLSETLEHHSTCKGEWHVSEILIYLNCGEKYKGTNDHRSYVKNLSRNEKNKHDIDRFFLYKNASTFYLHFFSYNIYIYWNAHLNLYQEITMILIRHMKHLNTTFLASYVHFSRP